MTRTGRASSATFLAPGLAIVGLLIVAIFTVTLLNGQLPFGVGQTPGGERRHRQRWPGPHASSIERRRRPDPPQDEPPFAGAITYAKAGNIWVQTPDGATQLTDLDGYASMPSWSPDGEYVYYIETKHSRGFWPVNGRPGTYDMEVPHLMRVRVDRSAPPEDLKSGRFRDGNLTWFSWMRQPVVSPNGKTVAMVTDQPRPDERDVVVQLYNLKSGKFSRPDLPVTSPLGHQDPTWRPDGQFLLFVRNGRAGAPGAPVIYRYDVKEKASRPLTTAGYLEPVVLARWEVRRCHADEHARHRRRDPGRPKRDRVAARHERRPLLGARSGRRRETGSRSSTSMARASTSTWPSSAARPERGPVDEVLPLDRRVRPGRRVQP